MKRLAPILLVILCAGCSVIYAAKNSTVNTHGGDILDGTNKVFRLDIPRL